MSVIYEPRGRAREYSPLACNLYDGCVHGCTYCYVPAALHCKAESFHASMQARAGILKRLDHDAVHYRNDERQVLLCFTCDPYPPFEFERGLTRSAIEILRANKIHFQVLTKGGLRAVRDFDLYRPGDAFATTLTFADDAGPFRRFEPQAAPPAQRIAAVKAAKNKHITTWVSLEPVLDPEQSLRCIEATHEFVDLYKIGKLNHVKSGIDWQRFAERAIELCVKYKVPYYLKADLAKFFKGA